jgi:hypothetical protein
LRPPTAAAGPEARRKAIEPEYKRQLANCQHVRNPQETPGFLKNLQESLSNIRNPQETAGFLRKLQETSGNIWMTQESP